MGQGLKKVGGRQREIKVVNRDSGTGHDIHDSLDFMDLPPRNVGTDPMADELQSSQEDHYYSVKEEQEGADAHAIVSQNIRGRK